jgi:hypothetical protein
VLPDPPAPARRPRFDPPDILWYFGGITAAVAAESVVGDVGGANRGVWIFLVAVLFLAGAGVLAAVALRAGWPVPGGVLAAVAVGLVPGVVVGFEHLVGAWPRQVEARDPFHDFEGFLFAVVVVTVAVGLLVFRLVRFGFVLLPVTVGTVLGAQLLLPAFLDRPGTSAHVKLLIATGIALVVVGMLLDARGHRAAAFWWHVVGLFALAIGLAYYVGVSPLLPGASSSTWAWVTMLLIGAALVVASFPVARATWAAYGVAGLYAPALHYTNDVSGSWRYPLLMVVVGLALMVAGALLDAAGTTWPHRLARRV